MEGTKGDVEVLERLENEVLEIKEMLHRLEVILIGDEEISDEEKRELERRLEEAERGETITLEEFLSDEDVQSGDSP